MHTHLQHLPPVSNPKKPPPWVHMGIIYNSTAHVYHYPPPLRTMAYIQGGRANNALMNRLQHELQTALCFSALDPALLPVPLQTRRAQLLLEQLFLLQRTARWYERSDTDIPLEYTICPCHQRQPETCESLRGNPPGHMATRENYHTTCWLELEGTCGQRGTTPAGTTGDQRSSITRCSADAALPSF